MKNKKSSKAAANSKNGPATASDIRQIIGVAVEHLDDKISLVAEQYGDIRETLGEHTKILDTHTETMGNLMVEMHIVKEDLEFIKNSLKKKVDIDEFIALERRVALLEKRR